MLLEGDGGQLLSFGLLVFLNHQDWFHNTGNYSASWLLQECCKVILICIAVQTVQDPNLNFSKKTDEIKG